MLVTSVDAKPKTRKKAVDVLDQVLDNAAAAERSGAAVLKFATTVLRDCRQDNVHPTLYLLELLKKIAAKVPHVTKKKLCEAILRLPSLGHAVVTVCSFNVFGNKSLFDGHHLVHKKLAIFFNYLFCFT